MPHDDTTQIRELKFSLPRVLIVDDDPLTAERLKELVSAAGFYAAVAMSGAAALTALAAEFMPIVVLDRNMPGMDGLSICQAIRNRRLTGYVYIILLTALDTEEDVLSGLDAGADDYISKRASPAQLIARLRTAQRIIELDEVLRNRLEEKSEQAMMDMLTGIPNRRYFMQHLGRELKQTQRVGGTLSLLLLDLDHFKRVNEQHGTAVGDEVLQELARRLRAGLPRESDWFARVGGEEFAVVLSHTPFTGARLVAERLRSQIGHPAFKTSAGRLEITVSIGVSGTEAVPRSDTLTAERLLERADQCLYRSKDEGRNRVTIADPVDPAARKE